MKLCPYCSGELPKNSKVCTHCGMKIETKKKVKEEPRVEKQGTTSSETMEDYMYQAMGLEKVGPLYKLVSIVLCVCLGFLGAHKIYERKYIMALLYACTGGLCGIGIIIDLLFLFQKPKVYYVYRQKL